MKISFNPSNSNKNILDLIKNNKDIIFDLKGHSIFARGVEFKGTDTNTWRDIKINNVSIGSHTLDLRNGSNTTLTNTNGVVTINSTWRPVVDNLTSDSTTSSLSAKQGKVLKALIDGKSNSDHNHDGRYVRYYAVTTLDCNNLAAGLTAARISATNAAHTNHSAYLYISDVETPFQIQIPDSSIPYIYKRYYGSGKWSGWFKLNAGYADSAGSVAWANVTERPSEFKPAAHTHTVFKNNLMIKGTNGISDSASIHLGIGDSDTGFKWISDGVCQIYANNVAVGQWTSGGMNWFKNPTVNGNKVWNAGNDGSGSGLDADTLDGYHANSFLIDRGGNYSGLIYDLSCKSIFSGNNLGDAPTTGWVSGIVLGSNWNSSHYQHYLVESGSRWYATRGYSNGKMTNWNTFAYLTDIPTVTNYYWANIKVSASSSTTTSPTVSNLTATNSIRLCQIYLEHTNEINSYGGGLFLNYRSSEDVNLCQGGGNVCIGVAPPTQKLDVRGNIITKGLGIQPYYLSKSVLPTIKLDDGYTYKCLEINATTEISCIIADRAGRMSERGILIKFNKGYDGQIILLKDLQTHGSGNGYFWVMPSGCKIISADNIRILVDQNQMSDIYDDGHSRFLVYSSVYSVWMEFRCSSIPR